MSECWRLKCSEAATHRVSGTTRTRSKAGANRSVTCCLRCAKDLVEDGKWGQYEPLSAKEDNPEGPP